MHVHLAVLVLFAGPAFALQDPSSAVTVAPDAKSPTAGIQEAIDRLGSKGGVVTLPPGEFLLRQSVRVRSGVTLQGSGEKTVLRKNKHVGSKLTAATGGNTARVENASGFREGDEVAFFDRTTVGWLHGHAVVTGVRENELQLDRNPGGRFDPANGGAVVNIFSAIRGVGTSRGAGLSNVVLRDLTIDGRSDENPGPSVVAARAPGKPPDLGFQFAALNLMDATNLVIDGCRVKGWPSDGISVQRGSGNRVLRCLVENCRGPGYHAGGGERESVFSENEARGNLGDGFYFCAKVTRIVVRNNKFIGNKANGVGGLGEWGDLENTVENNLCESNGASGIALWDGESNIVRNNTCLNNSKSSPGQWSGISLAKSEKSVITGNRCYDTQKTKTQKHGIYESPNCRENVIRNNDCRENAGSGVALAGQGGQKDGNRE